MDIPEIPQEVKDNLKQQRLSQYQARIFGAQMDIVAYEAVGDKARQTAVEKLLTDLVTSYYAIEAMQ